jgi:ATP-dependent NAD(P)H-hydrate dehydratase
MWGSGDYLKLNIAGPGSKMAAMRQDILKSIKVLAPPLSFDQHKGQAGRIGIIGGSIEWVKPFIIY